jgi:enamine deaminase RidA (YjgF/YER057c/UK114 family)
LVLVSGTTATDENGNLVGINQMYVQARQAIANLSRALERLGATLENVVRTRIFLTDIKRFDEVARAHREAFGGSPPATSAVQVCRLVHPDMMVEIEADAVVADRQPRKASAPAALVRPKTAAPVKKIRPKKSPRSRRK